jgi:zinc transport system substrate-binding protein
VAEPAEGADRLSVYASFFPMYDFAVKIGGERVDAVNMVPTGVEPHDWEPGTADIAGLTGADVFIYNGADMEHWVEDVLESLRNDRLAVVEASSGIELMEGHHHDHDHDDHDHEDEDEHDDHDEDHDEPEGHDDHEEGGHDPHVWLNPRHAKIQMRNIRDALKLADPDGAGYYDANYDKYAAMLDELDAEFTGALAEHAGKDIIVAHQAFGYLCAAYGLNQVPIEGLAPDSEPSPARMAEVIEFAREHSISVIFFEELVSPKVAETIAEAIGARTDVLNPLEGLGEDSPADADYFSIMRANLQAIVQSF